MRTRLNSLPLFWRVFGTNAAVLVRERSVKLRAPPAGADTDQPAPRQAPRQ